VNQVNELTRVAAWLEQTARLYLLPERVVFKLDMVLNEALPNIMSYAFSDELTHDIVIRLENGNDHVILEITDDGIEFNPFSQEVVQESQPLEFAPIGGRGISLINYFTDEQEYHRHNHTNMMRVRILKIPEANQH
jgi:anti-sigma regulatory factor (Ser/Thr protein kinase)